MLRSYHSGTYEGVTLLKLMRNLDDIFCDIVRYLKRELEKNATIMMCTTEVVEEVCGHYKELHGPINRTFTMLRIKVTISKTKIMVLQNGLCGSFSKSCALLVLALLQKCTQLKTAPFQLCDLLRV